MNRFVLSIVLGGSFFSTSLALADDVPIPEKRPTKILVHMSGDEAVLEGHANDGAQITCASPCDRALPADAEYRALSQVGTSPPFTLHRDERNIDVAVKSGSKTAHDAGLALTILGGIATGVGAAVLAYGAVDHYDVGATGAITQYGIFVYPTATNVGPYHDVMIAGALTAGAGIVALVSGLILYATNRKTTIAQTAITF